MTLCLAVGTFEIIVKVNNKDVNVIGENYFVFSTDGKMLTETKRQTEREVVAEGVDPAKGAERRTSVTVLVFDKAP